MDHFPTDPSGLPEALAHEIVDLPPGGSFDLRVHPVSKRIGDAVVGMLAYNGSIPGPTLRVRRGSEVEVRVTNGMETETTVHWHGLRLRNEHDGVPHETQAPIPPGGSYTHRLTFPDAGLFWYHPHVREDYAQELGLYGNVIVVPEDPSYWGPADREVVLTLDDILIEDGAISPFDAHAPNFAAMGRFGNVLLIGGETERALAVARGEVVRFLLTNTANTRVFKVALPGARMKLVGGDAGRYEREQRVDSVVVAPSERAIVDVAFDDAGSVTLQHVTPQRVYPLVSIEVAGDGGRSPDGFDDLRVNDEMVAERARSAAYLDAAPEKTLALVAEIHTEHGHGHEHHHHGGGATADGIEWEDEMFEANRAMTTANTRWMIVDRDTGKEGADIDWSFDEGAQVKIRLVNEMESDHPMHHPFHVHGQRFLVLARNGDAEPNLVWKDTVLVRTGETVDLLLDASNPGLWMAHCHIAEHMEAGMMFSFAVGRSRLPEA